MGRRAIQCCGKLSHRVIRPMDGTKWRQDYLAEHAMHSPVWISHDPGLEFMDYESDWDNSADEYYDVRSSSPGKRKSSSNHEQSRKGSKRRRLEPTQQIPAMTLDGANPVRQPVVWKPLSQRLRSPELPLLREGEAKKVALLKDWREQFNVTASQRTPVQSPPTRSKRKSLATSRRISQTELNGRDYVLEEEEMGPSPELPPTSIVPVVEEPPLPKKNRLSAHMNGAASNIAKQAMQQASEAKGKALVFPGNGEMLAPTEVKTAQPAIEDTGSMQKGNVGPKKRETEKHGERGHGGSRTRGKRKAEDNVDEFPPKKKSAMGQGKTTSDVAKSKQMPVSLERKTRSKKS